MMLHKTYELTLPELEYEKLQNKKEEKEAIEFIVLQRFKCMELK